MSEDIDSFPMQIILKSKEEASAILADMLKCIELDGVARLPDLVVKMGWTAHPGDERMGWTELNGQTSIATIKGRITLIIPQPVRLPFTETPVMKQATLIDMHGADVYEPAPVKNDKPHAWDFVINEITDRKKYEFGHVSHPWNLILDDMRKRDEMGVKKHHMHLQPFNGRDALWDAYQESLDADVYLGQKLMEYGDLDSSDPNYEMRARVYNAYIAALILTQKIKIILLLEEENKSGK